MGGIRLVSLEKPIRDDYWYFMGINSDLCVGLLQEYPTLIVRTKCGGSILASRVLYNLVNILFLNSPSLGDILTEGG
jgi:hypothetical protein